MMVVGIVRLNRESKAASRGSGRPAPSSGVAAHSRRPHLNDDGGAPSVRLWENGASQPPSEFHYDEYNRAASWAYSLSIRGVADRMQPPGEAPPAYEPTAQPIQPPSYEEATANSDIPEGGKEIQTGVETEMIAVNQQQDQRPERQTPKPHELAQQEEVTNSQQ